MKIFNISEKSLVANNNERNYLFHIDLIGKEI